MGNKPNAYSCSSCGAPVVDGSHVNLLEPLEDLVRVIRAFRFGDYSPAMDEVFDAESAIRLAKNKPISGIDYEGRIAWRKVKRKLQRKGRLKKPSQ